MILLKDGATFTVRDDIVDEHSKLVALVMNTESIDNDERQYWFDTMPIMTDEQIDRLYDILETERRKLAELEDRYNDEISKLNEAHSEELMDFVNRIPKHG